jgi:2-C-methyl-D-erythritol 4-phosphate cytidylyltransferase
VALPDPDLPTAPSGRNAAVALVLAAGRGVRLEGRAPPPGKAFLPILERPMLFWSLRALDACDAIRAIVIVAPAGEEARAAVEGIHRKVAAIVAGGAERQDSLGAGLEALADREGGDPLVAVHDAARPLITPADTARVVAVAARFGAAILAVPVKDTIKEVAPEGRIRGTPDRERLWIAQTPQVARASHLREGLAKARADGRRATDEASLLEALGIEVRVVQAEEANLKVTTEEDARVAQAILREREGAP